MSQRKLTESPKQGFRTSFKKTEAFAKAERSKYEIFV